MNKKALITGSAGLIGSESVRFFCSLGFDVVGIDNDMRKYFFGDEASTDWNRRLLENQYSNYRHYSADIRDSQAIEEIFKNNKFDLIIHAAAQPSHDWAAREPFTDFSVNATGTLVMLENFKKYSPEAVFIFTSTNKVYGDTPNYLPLIELETRYEIDPGHAYANGINESMTIDSSKHSIFGASKVAADVMVQEYGRYFNLYTGIFRGGCLTGPAHSGTELHGFLAYLIKAIAEGRPYIIYGYKGKQVRDNIHSSDLIQMFYEFYQKPRVAEVYNAGGSRHSNISMMEAIEKTESFLGKKGNISYSDQNRSGDHMWYVSDVSKFKEHYPNWEFKYDIDDIIQEICQMGHFSRPAVGNLVLSEIGSTAGNNQVFVSSHVTEAYGPVQALKAYLIKRYSRLVFVEHPFTYSNISASSLGAYRGSLMSDSGFAKKFQSEVVSYASNFLLTLYWFLRKGRKSKTYIGIDALNTLAGVVLKYLGFKFKLIYYSVDYSPSRFRSSFLNTLYKYIDKFAAKRSDYVWNTSERIRDIRRKQGIEENRNLLVENGVYLEKMPQEDTQSFDKNVLVMVEHLIPEKGVQLAIESLKDIRKLNPNASLVVIGTGPFEDELKRLAVAQSVQDYVHFEKETDPTSYLSSLKKYGVGLCLHNGNSESFVYYSDPISPKEILQAGLPLVITDNLAISKDVENYKLGDVISYNSGSLIVALKNLWDNDELYNKYKNNALSYISGKSWDKIYDDTFSKLT